MFSEADTQRRRVRFTSPVLMQQAITEGDVEEIKQLISTHGSEIVSCREPSGLTPVMRAVFESQTECLKLLVEEGADLTAKDDELWTPLHVAAAMDDVEAAEFIIDACNVNLIWAATQEGHRPLDLAESSEMAKLLWE